MGVTFNDLQGKVCVITGGAGVLGRSMAMALARAGAIPVLLDLSAQRAEEAAAEIRAATRGPALGVSADVLDRASLEAARLEINGTLGPIHRLINAAGGNSPRATTRIEQLPAGAQDLTGSFFDLDLDGFQWVFDLNFTGTLLPTVVLTRDMLAMQSGAILNISSMNSFRPLTKIPAYSAAKASINNFTQWLAVHLGRAGIRVNALAPGFFLTEQNRFLLIDQRTGMPTPRGQKIMDSTPMGAYGHPDHLQGATLFLLSDLAAFITGVVLPVDGGYSAFGGV